MSDGPKPPKEERAAAATLGLACVSKSDLDAIKKLGGEHAPDVPTSYRMLHGYLAVSRLDLMNISMHIMRAVEASKDPEFILSAARALPNIHKQITESVRVAAERFEAAESVKVLKGIGTGRGARRRLGGFPEGPLLVQQINVGSKETEKPKEIDVQSEAPAVIEEHSSGGDQTPESHGVSQEASAPPESR